MRLRQLLGFVRVCELGSITRAAAELNVAQPALGLQIRSLEHDFDADLLVRTSRGVSPTASGELVLAWARDMLERTGQVRERIKELQGNRAVPSITIGLTASLTILLARAIVEGTAESKMKIKIVEGLSQAVAEWVDNGVVDIGLGFGVLETKGVQSVAILRERLFYVSAAGEPNTPITLAEVLDKPLALPDEQNSIRHISEAAARTIDMPLIGRYEVGSLNAVREIARSGKAGAITPFGGVVADQRAGELSVRLIVDPTVERTLYLMRKAANSPSAAENMLAAVIYQALEEVAHRDGYSGAYTLLDDPRNMSNLWGDA